MESKEYMSHTSIELLQQKRFNADQLVEVGACYYHYRAPHFLYRVIGIGLQEATEELCVIYQNIDNQLIWVRNLDDWCSLVEHEGQLVARFQKVSL